MVGCAQTQVNVRAGLRQCSTIVNRATGADKPRFGKIRSLEYFCSEIAAADRRKIEAPGASRGQRAGHESPERAKEGSDTTAARPATRSLPGLPTRSLSDTHAIAPNWGSIRSVHQTFQYHYQHSPPRPESLLRNRDITFAPRKREIRKFHISGDSQTRLS